MSHQYLIEKLTNEKRTKISNDLKIYIDIEKFGEDRYIICYDIIDDITIILPFYYAIQEHKIKRPLREEYPPMKIKFEGMPREEQKEIISESISKLNKTGTVMISAYPGFGKTACSIYLSCSIKMKVLIIVNKIILIKQWEESIMKFCKNATIQKITPKSQKKDADFYIINAQNTQKMGGQFFSDIGTLIVDEAHLIMAETLCKSLQYIHPRYVMGLSATPYRPDGLNKLLDLYFGPEKIVRKLWRDHFVYKINSSFKPKVEYMFNGKLNWNSVIDSQANNVKRNELIIQLSKKFKDRNILILCKRVSQAEFLEKRLNEENESVTSLIGSNQEFDKNARILVGTGQKVGTGFDHPKLDMLILASDIEQYFIQYLGRVFRVKDIVPIIIDIVDKNPVLSKHYRTRLQVYKNHGGKVKECDEKLNSI